MKNITIKIQFCLFILFTLFLGNSNLFAQQEAIYSQYMFNRMVINPAYAGVKGCLDLTAQYRHQWTSFPNAPRNFLASGHIGIDKFISKEVDETPYGTDCGIVLQPVNASKVSINN